MAAATRRAPADSAIIKCAAAPQGQIGCAAAGNACSIRRPPRPVTIVGMAAPAGGPLALPTDAALRAEYFTERRELGALNIGGSGSINVNGKRHGLENL